MWARLQRGNAKTGRGPTVPPHPDCQTGSAPCSTLDTASHCRTTSAFGSVATRASSVVCESVSGNWQWCSLTPPQMLRHSDEVDSQTSANHATPSTYSTPVCNLDSKLNVRESACRTGAIVMVSFFAFPFYLNLVDAGGRLLHLHVERHVLLIQIHI